MSFWVDLFSFHRASPQLAELGVAIAGLVAELDLDAHEAVVLGDTVGTAEGTSLDLAAVRCDSDVSDSGVLGLA